MQIEILEILAAILVALFSGVLGVIWLKADRAERTAESNKLFIAHLTKTVDKTSDLTERLTSLEASVSVEIKNLSTNIKRLENAILEIHQKN